MFQRIWKFLTPKSLLWRGILLIGIPIITLHILLSVLIVQRYFDKVTGQLVGHVTREINAIERQAPDSFVIALEALGYEVAAGETIEASQFDGFADLSGRYILTHLSANLNRPVKVSSNNTQAVKFGFYSDGVDYVITAQRSWLAPSNPHQILFNVFAFSLLFFGLSVFVLRNQVRSIKRLALAANAYGRGEVSPYSPSGALEVREAWQNFLIMRSRIERQREQRGLMLSGLSHDFRTPLTRLRLGVELIDDDETRDGLLGDIHDLDSMIDSFLEYSANNATEDYKQVRIDVLIRDIASKYPSATVNDIAPLTLRIRPQMIKRALTNLLDNAVQHAQHIEVSLIEGARNIHIRISDDGPGIAKSDRDTAIKAFTRLDQSRNQNQGAHAGLGLAIAADVARQHGGTLELDKSELGGLEATLRLPKPTQSALSV